MTSCSKPVYTPEFYEGQLTASYKSARRYASELLTLYKPSSIIDVGCGTGAWLKAFGELCPARLVGVDGCWNKQANMIDENIEFFERDLDSPRTLSGFGTERFDLAMSLEVAEHLKETSADQFVESLTNLSDSVLFGAAYTKQGGTNHINEQPHTYWAVKFKERDYLPFDLFREKFWGDSQISFWYQQNTFLYVQKSSPLFMILDASGIRPLVNLNFLNCIHPQLYQLRTNPDPFLKSSLRKIVPRRLKNILKKIGSSLVN